MYDVEPGFNVTLVQDDMTTTGLLGAQATAIVFDGPTHPMPSIRPPGCRSGRLCADADPATGLEAVAISRI